MCTITGLRQAAQNFRRSKIQEREDWRKLRDSSLYRIKESEPIPPQTRQKLSFLQYCCNSCTPASRVRFCTPNAYLTLPFIISTSHANPTDLSIIDIFSRVHCQSSLLQFHVWACTGFVELKWRSRFNLPNLSLNIGDLVAPSLIAVDSLFVDA